jgi:hypothetical protein
LSAVERRVEGATLESAPLRARQSGVRTAETMTTSLGDLGVVGGISKFEVFFQLDLVNWKWGFGSELFLAHLVVFRVVYVVQK